MEQEDRGDHHNHRQGGAREGSHRGRMRAGLGKALHLNPPTSVCCLSAPLCGLRNAPSSRSTKPLATKRFCLPPPGTFSCVRPSHLFPLPSSIYRDRRKFAVQPEKFQTFFLQGKLFLFFHSIRRKKFFFLTIRQLNIYTTLN